MPPRRANDPNLLRAQAAGGRDGERAYSQAQAQLQQQRQNAVRTAMQEAAMRGAPQAAIAGIRADVSQPYNQAMREMTQQSGSYQAALDARDQRVGAYDQAVQSARTLIPGQVRLAVAPIRAQNQFMLTQQRIAGEQQVNQIEAQTQLQLAQMRSDALMERLRLRRELALRRQEQEQQDNTLNQSQLYASLVGGAQQQLSAGEQAAREIATRAAAQYQEGPRMAAAATGFEAQQSQEEAIGARTAASWAYAATAGEAARQAALGTQQEEETPPTLVPSQRSGGMFRIPTGPIVPPQQPIQTAADIQSAPSALDEARRLAQANAGGLEALTGAADVAAGEYQQRLGAYHEALSMPAYPENVFAPGSDATRQLARRAGAPLAALFSTAERPAQVPGDISRLLGQPSATTVQPVVDPNTGEVVSGQINPGDIDPVAYDAWQQALVMAGQRLAQQGYDINDPDIQYVLQKDAGRTFYDVMAQQRGLPSGRVQLTDEQQAAQRQVSDIESNVLSPSERRAAASDIARQDSDRMKTELGLKGIAYTPSLGPLELVYAQVVNDPTASAQFEAARDQILKALESQPGLNVDRALDDAKIFDPIMRRLVKASVKG